MGRWLALKYTDLEQSERVARLHPDQPLVGVCSIWGSRQVSLESDFCGHSLLCSHHQTWSFLIFSSGTLQEEQATCRFQGFLVPVSGLSRCSPVIDHLCCRLQRRADAGLLAQGSAADTQLLFKQQGNSGWNSNSYFLNKARGKWNFILDLTSLWMLSAVRLTKERFRLSKRTSFSGSLWRWGKSISERKVQRLEYNPVPPQKHKLRGREANTGWGKHLAGMNLGKGWTFRQWF